MSVETDLLKNFKTIDFIQNEIKNKIVSKICAKTYLPMTDFLSKNMMDKLSNNQIAFDDLVVSYSDGGTELLQKIFLEKNLQLQKTKFDKLNQYFEDLYGLLTLPQETILKKVKTV